MRKVVDLSCEEFRKTPSDVSTTDDFGAFHVFYDNDDCCKAGELFNDIKVSRWGVGISNVAERSSTRHSVAGPRRWRPYFCRRMYRNLRSVWSNGEPHFGAKGYYE